MCSKKETAENENKLEWTNCLHPAPKNERKHLLHVLKKQDPKNWILASYFYENGIAFNTAASSSFALMTEESMKFARQNPLQSYKVPHSHKFSGKLLDKSYESTEKLVAPILAVAKKYGATIVSDGFMCESV